MNDLDVIIQPEGEPACLGVLNSQATQSAWHLLIVRHGRSVPSGTDKR